MRQQPGYPLAKVTANKSSSEHSLPPLICTLSLPYKVHPGGVSEASLMFKGPSCCFGGSGRPLKDEKAL